MNTSLTTFSITELRHQTNKVLAEAKLHGCAYLLKHSQVEGVLVDPKYLKMLQDAYEDYLDTLEFDETVDLPRVPLEEKIASTQ